MDIDHIKSLQNNNPQNSSDVDMLKSIILKQEKVKTDNSEIRKTYEKINSSWEKTRDDLLKNKTNTPYKHIIPQKDEKHVHGFDYTQIIDRQEQLTIHKVTEKDRDAKKLENSFGILNEKRNCLDKDNRVIYSEDKKLEHKKKFDYEHVYVYKMVHDPKGHGELKGERISLYEKEQREREKGKEMRDAILLSLQEDDKSVDVMLNSLLNKEQPVAQESPDNKEHSRDSLENNKNPSSNIDNELHSLLSNFNLDGQKNQQSNKSIDDLLKDAGII